MTRRRAPSAATEAQWRALLEKALGGEPIESLVVKTRDQIPIQPLWAPASATRPRPWPRRGGAWRICARVDHVDCDSAIEQARVDLDEGATGLVLVFAGAPCAYGFGLRDDAAACAAEFFGRVRAAPDVDLELQCDTRDAEATAQFLSAWSRQADAAGWSALRFAVDPALVDPSDVLRVARDLRSRPVSLFCADGRRIHGAGGTEAQELASVVSAALKALRAGEASGVGLEETRALLMFRLVADTDFLLTVAKFRALRLLWARVESLCGLEPKPIELRAETAWRTMTRRDPWGNALRSGIAAAGAALGGADALAVLPHTQAQGLPESGARRLALATQLVLLHEAHLAKAADPSGGAGAFEAMTQDLCLTAWSLFQDIERAGGLAGALEVGLAQDKVAAARADLIAASRMRAEPIVGVSLYPAPLEERRQPVLAAHPDAPSSYAGLPLVRLAQPWEELQDRADALRLSPGNRTRVLLIPFGDKLALPSLVLARSLFEAAGFTVRTLDDDPHAANNGQEPACLCLGTAVPMETVLEEMRALARPGGRRIYACGAPQGMELALSAQGVRGFLRPDGDVVAVLADALGDESPLAPVR